MFRPQSIVVRLSVIVLIGLLPLSLVTAASSLTLVSGNSPFASCTAGSGPTGVVNYLNAEVEPYVAVNPTNSKNLVGVWQQDRWNDGGAHGLVAGYSFNGGKTWSETAQPFSVCAPGGVPYERASDPWVSFGPDGTAYSVSISFNESNNNNAVAAAVSKDGGKTWTNAQTLITDGPSFQFFNDKESVTADPVTAGTAYAVWDRLEDPNGNPRANLHTAAFTGPTYFSKTTDGGVTWSKPQIIVNTGQNQQTIDNQILVYPRAGVIYDFFSMSTPPYNISTFKAAFVKSTDGGATWTAPQVFANVQTVGVIDPNNGFGIRTGDIIPEPTINPQTGQLYVVWQDSRFNGGQYDEVAFSTSTDGGATWTAPIRVNTPTGTPAFTPSIKISSDGTIGVTYYDFRNLQAGNTTTLPTDYWFTSSSNGGAGFGGETHLAGSFDMLTAPYAFGYFVGDYEGLTSIGTTFYPFFVQTTGTASNPTDVFVLGVTPSTSSTTGAAATNGSASSSTGAPVFNPVK